MVHGKNCLPEEFKQEFLNSLWIEFRKRLVKRNHSHAIRKQTEPTFEQSFSCIMDEQEKIRLKNNLMTQGRIRRKIRKAQREFFFLARVNNTSCSKDLLSHCMDDSNTKMNRGCTVPVEGPVTQDPKRYVFGLTPPRHLTGGLLSSWLVNQQFSRDGCKWTHLYSPHPRKLGSHVATLLPVLGLRNGPSFVGLQESKNSLQKNLHSTGM